MLLLQAFPLNYTTKKQPFGTSCVSASSYCKNVWNKQFTNSNK
jgi:hypothetical protein